MIFGVSGLSAWEPKYRILKQKIATFQATLQDVGDTFERKQPESGNQKDSTAASAVREQIRQFNQRLQEDYQSQVDRNRAQVGEIEKAMESIQNQTKALQSKKAWFAKNSSKHRELTQQESTLHFRGLSQYFAILTAFQNIMSAVMASAKLPV